MLVARPHTRLAGGFAVIAVASAMALPAGAGAASSSTASAASGEPAAVASGTKGRKKCRGNKVAVRKRGRVRCVRKRRPGGDALRDGRSRQTQPQQQAVSEHSPAAGPAAPAEQPALPEQVQSTAPPGGSPDNQGLRADSLDELRNQILGNTVVGGAPTYYRQSCSDWWWEYGFAIRQCWSNSDRAYHYRFEWDYWNGHNWVTYAARECVNGVCG